MLSSQNQFQILKPRNIIAFLWAVSIVLGVTLSSPLLLGLSAGCLATFIMAGFKSWGLLKSIRVRRLHHSRVFQGNSVAVSLEVMGVDRTSPELVLVEDNFTPSTTTKVRRLVESPLEKDMVVHINFFGLCEHRRGMYVLGPVRAEAYDPLGFFRRELHIDEFTELVIYPQAVDLQAMDLLGEGTLRHVGLETTRRTGISEEFQGIREYRPGDSPRIVHWKSTAHHQNIMVKEFMEEMTTEVTFFLDMGRLGLVGVGDQTSVEYGIKCCATISKRAVERGHHVAMHIVSSEVESIAMGSGTAHLLNILDRLAFVKAEGDSAFSLVVSRLARQLRRGSTAVMIMGATTIDFDAITPAIKQMLDRQVLPILILIDDRAFIKIFREQENRHVEALPLEEITRLLRILGARVHIIRRAKSMSQALLQGLEREAV